MFRKYNRKIITVIVIVIVAMGLIGPGIILIFMPREFSQGVREPAPVIMLSPEELLENTGIELRVVTSSEEQ